MTQACVSELKIDRMLAGELSADDTTALRAHASGCAECGELLRTAEVVTRRFADAPPPLRYAPRRAGAALVAATAAAAAIALVVMLGREDPARDVRTKGRPTVGVYVLHGGVLRRAQPGEVVAPGDRLQLVTTIERTGWLAVTAVHGVAARTVYARPQPVLAGRDRPLPFSIIIDDARGATTLTATFCTQPFALDAPPADCTTDTVVLEVR